jgi:DGQHR domain-containing protein
MSDNTLIIKSLKTQFGNIDVYTQPMKVKDLVYIYYVAVRGRDDEDGAVQRVLNKQRIKAIKDFVLSGNMFFNTFILNWTEPNKTPTFGDGYIEIPMVPSAAQVIDGQHRLAGLDEAIKEDENVGEKEVLVSICIRLTTKEAAKIFLNINSEQRPVPKSLIYDLYGVVEDDKKLGLNRANDIATELNDNEESPYYKAVKYPGAPRGVGIIDLSTIVSSLKSHLEVDGVFVNYNLKDLTIQKQVIINFFNAIKYYYDKMGFWTDKAKNPFYQSAGFSGAIDFFTSVLLSKCAEKRSFRVDTFRSIINLDFTSLLLQKDIKNLDGKSARKKVKEFLETSLKQNLPEQNEYEY